MGVGAENGEEGSGGSGYRQLSEHVQSVEDGCGVRSQGKIYFFYDYHPKYVYMIVEVIQ